MIETYVICKSLTKFIKDLNDENFIKTSQSYVINKNFIQFIDKKTKIISLGPERRIPYTIPFKELMYLLDPNYELEG